MLVKVPANIKGATALKVHEWVMSHSGSDNYTLQDATTGQPTDVTQVASGMIGEVVIGERPRSNPAPSYAFKPSAQPQKHITQFRSRVVTPEGLSPSIVQAVEANHGTNVAVHLLTKMLSQRSRHTLSTPRGGRILKSFVRADPRMSVRSNPVGLRQTPSGLRMARVLGEGSRVLDDQIIAEVQRYIDEANEYSVPHDFPASQQQFEAFRTNVLQPYLIAIEANRALLRYINLTLLPHMKRLIDNGEFDRSAYVSTGLGTRIKRGLKLNKNELKEGLERQYNTLVARLATSPADFYNGRNEALIAHPGFIYPQLQYALLPIPDRLTGGSRAELFMYQVGEPPRYSTDNEGNVIQELPARIQEQAPTDAEGNIVFPVARVNNRPVDFGRVVNPDTIMRSLRAGNFGEVLVAAGRFWTAPMSNLRNILGAGGAMPTGPMSDAEQNAVRDLNNVINDIQQAGPTSIMSAGNFENLPLVAAMEVNIGGLKPRPHRWPEHLIMAMMEIMSENSDQIIRTDGAGVDAFAGAGDAIGAVSPFFQPNLNTLPPNMASRIQLTPPTNLGNVINNFTPRIRELINSMFTTGISLNDLVYTQVNEAEDGLDDNTVGDRAYAASVALHMAIDVNGLDDNRNPIRSYTHDRHHGALGAAIIPNNNSRNTRNAAREAFNELQPNPTTHAGAGDARIVKFVHILGNRRADYGLDGSTPNRLSILHIMQLAITRCKERGQEPTPEQVTFVIHLLMWCVANLDTDIEPIQENLGDLIANLLGRAQGRRTQAIRREQEDFINRLGEWHDNNIVDGDLIQEIVINQLLAEFLNDEANGLAGALGLGLLDEDEVLDNPNHRAFTAGPRSFDVDSSFRDIVGQAVRGSGEESLDRDVIRQVKRNIEDRNNMLIRKFGDNAPSNMLLESLTNAIRGTFREAVRKSIVDLEEAKQAATANQRIQRLLERESIQDATRGTRQGFLRLMNEVNTAVSRLTRHEEEYINFVAENLPEDPYADVSGDVLRTDLMNHPVYIVQDILGRHRSFMNDIQITENMARAALSGMQLFTQSDVDLDMNESRINLLTDLIGFTNSMQEEYGSVGPKLEAALDDMRSDGERGDNISPQLYLAAFDIADNFQQTAAARNALRQSAATDLSPIDPHASMRAFEKVMDKCLGIVAELFGAFPVNVDPPPLDIADSYLKSLVDANIGFGGDTETQMRREDLIAEAVSPREAERRRLLRQRDMFYEAQEAEERAQQRELTRIKNMTFSGRGMGKASAFMDQLDQQVRDAQLEKTRAGLFADLETKQMRFQKNRANLERERKEREEQAAYDKKISNEMFKIALRTPGSEVRNQLMQRKMELEKEFAPDYVVPKTPEDQAYQLHVIANGIALNTLRTLGPKNGGITKKMYDRAIKGQLPVDSVKRMLKGLEKGRAKQARQRYEAALLKGVQEAVAIEKPTFATPEELTNDAYVRYMMGVSEQDLAYAKSGANLPALSRLTGESDYEYDDSPNKFGMRSSDYGAGTGEYALFNPSNMLDVYNARGDLIGEVSAQKAVSIIDRHGYIKRGHAIYPGDYDATQELLAEMRDLEKMTDQHHAQYDSKPFRRGSGHLPAFGAAQTVPVSDRRARNTTGAPAIQWSESGAAAPTTSTSRPVTRPMGRDAFAPRLNGKEVKWLD
tara:strand:+ start:8402 stop:13366 length:4965 start_codon:yes stop_codon:yes gene_type:complete